MSKLFKVVNVSTSRGERSIDYVSLVYAESKDNLINEIYELTRLSILEAADEDEEADDSWFEFLNIFPGVGVETGEESFVLVFAEEDEGFHIVKDDANAEYSDAEWERWEDFVDRISNSNNES